MVFTFIILSTDAQSQIFNDLNVFYRTNLDNINHQEPGEILRIRTGWFNQLKSGSIENVRLEIPISDNENIECLISKKNIF